VNELAPDTFERVIEQQVDDIPLSIHEAIPSLDGEVVIIGQKASKVNRGTSAGFWLKMDQKGVVNNIKELGTTNFDTDLVPTDIVRIDETNYAMCGYRITQDGPRFSFFILDTNSESGVVRRFYTKEAERGTAYTLASTLDGGFLIGGSYQSRAILTKLNAEGDLEWEQLFDDVFSINEIIIESADSYTLLVQGRVVGEAYLMAFQSDGSNSRQPLNGSYGSNSILLNQLSNGQYVYSRGEVHLRGSTWSEVIAYDRAQQEIWRTTRLGDINIEDLQPTNDGGVIITGTILSNRLVLDTSPVNAHLTKLDAMGNIEWAQSYGQDLADQGRAVVPLEDGGYFLIGIDRSISGRDEIPGSKGIYLIRTNENGEVKQR